MASFGATKFRSRQNWPTHCPMSMSSIIDRDRVLQISSGRSGPSGVRIEVVDSETGTPQESIDRVFDHFYTTKTHGMGVRLSICRSIVENHGGQLAASRLDTYGTIFLPPRLRIDCG
jgi:signal transduction histidine kinase